MVRNRFVCIVQGNHQDRLWLQELFDRFLSDYLVSFSASGQLLLEQLAQMNPYPGLILFDQPLLEREGYQALLTMKRHPAYARLPIVILSDKPSALDRDRLQELGINSYVLKEQDSTLLKTTLLNICHYWLTLTSFRLMGKWPPA